VQAGEAEKALETLDASAAVLSNTPLVYLYRAQAQMQLGDATEALLNAQQANRLDTTLLPAYRVIG